jgi:hypothetical protein
MTGKVVAVCISEKKGTNKTEVSSITLKPEYGIAGDAHAGNWHRQVSMLAHEKIEDFRARGADVDFGAFGENIIVEGFDLSALPVGTRFRIGDALLELTQIGKECHTHCAIYHQVGDCIMPREGVSVSMFNGEHQERHRRLMQALDSINSRVGDGSVVVASAGLSEVKANSAHRSPGYTTNWNDLPVVK